ncbi:MAG: SusD/RagB family nutrient-binding outer membrane lipoprotein [Bacteroidales bacterium]|nr:SusD/RagB family nutrient-binding outer membrane lipoprotein [Bacteroidales bacterium]
MFFWGCVLLVFVTACTDGFRDANTDRTGITDEQLAIDYNNLGMPLTVIQQGIYFNYDFGKGKNWPFQIMQNLSADMFSGYMHDYKPHNGGSSNTDYNLQDGWNGTFWENTYAYIFPQIKRSEDSTRMNHSDLFGITKILKVETMHRVSDYYGPIIYTYFGIEGSKDVPDSQKDAYNAFFADLDSAVFVLDKYLQTNDDLGRFAKFDILLDGKYSSWIKFANSLRLRLAIRIAMVDPEKAKSEFLKGISNPYGVFETVAEKVEVSTKSGYTNPLGEINRIWNEAYMNANMESILTGYKDPRLSLFFEPCLEVALQSELDEVDEQVHLKGTFKGIRQGTGFSHQLYITHSRLYVNQSTDAILMTSAEIWFLRAEAALRGWTSEDAGTCYRNGITTSFSQWGASGITDYLESDKMAADYKDAFDELNDIKARCKVSPRWIEDAEPEVKLEKIITQKWLAMFPEGCEAWAEQRRTGYPRLFPVRINNSKDGCIDTEIMIRRLNFPTSLIDSDPSLYKALQDAFGVPDNAGSRLWWDIGRNF